MPLSGHEIQKVISLRLLIRQGVGVRLNQRISRSAALLTAMKCVTAFFIPRSTGLSPIRIIFQGACKDNLFDISVRQMENP